MNKVYQAYYDYTETYGSPYEREWSKEQCILMTSLDPGKVYDALQKYNEGKSRWDHARIREFELT